MRVNLESVCEILDNKRVPITSSDRKKGNYPYYGANGLQDYVDDYIFDDELVLLAEDGGNFGSINRPIAYRVSGKCWVNNHAHVLKAKDNIDVDYLCYSLIFYDTKGLVNGATRLKLTQQAMRQMKINLLPLPEQKIIAERLGSVDRLISLNTLQLEKLDTLIKSKFIEMFGDPIENPMKWKTSYIKNISTKIGSGATPKGGNASYKENGISLIRSMNVDYGKFDVKGLAHIDEKQAKLLEGVVVEKQDILLNITGASVARCCIIPESILPARVNQHVCIVRSIKEIISPIFLNQLLINKNYQKILLNIATASGATREALTKKQVEDLSVIIPPLHLQEQFASYVEQVEKTKTLVKQSIEKLETLKKSLMAQYFS